MNSQAATPWPGGARGHQGWSADSPRTTDAAMHYEIVNLGAGAPIHPELDVGPRAGACAPGELAPGTYATVVLKLPASQIDDGRALARGFYAVLWPMTDALAEQAAGPRCFGPFPSLGQASEFIRESAVPW